MDRLATAASFASVGRRAGEGIDGTRAVARSRQVDEHTARHSPLRARSRGIRSRPFLECLFFGAAFADASTRIWRPPSRIYPLAGASASLTEAAEFLTRASRRRRLRRTGTRGRCSCSLVSSKRLLLHAAGALPPASRAHRGPAHPGPDGRGEQASGHLAGQLRSIRFRTGATCSVVYEVFTSSYSIKSTCFTPFHGETPARPCVDAPGSETAGPCFCGFGSPSGAI